jgi:hypothetical protein
MTRHLVWHIANPGAPTPVYYVDRDSDAVALRIYAETAPNGGDMLVDILDDGVSIMRSNDYEKMTIKNEKGYIEFGTPSATAFTVGETISGTSGASAVVENNNHGRLTLALDSPNATVFVVGETITGASSSATGVVNAYVRQTRSASKTTIAGQSRASLPEGENSSDDAQDFIDGVQIEEGSWVSLREIDLNGASKITVQLDLDDQEDSEEYRTN